jgi:hypothetical protein
MRILSAAILAAALVGSNAYAATVVGPLAPGKPAGVKTAALEDNTLLILAGAGIVIGGIALVASGNSDGITTPTTNLNPPTTTTTAATTTTTTTTTQ